MSDGKPAQARGADGPERFTPGRWQAWPERLFNYRLHSAGRCPVVVDDAGKAIAEVRRRLWPPVEGREPEAEANAVFIAAAPDLYKAARALLDDVRRRYPGEELRCPFMQALDAAVAKAVTPPANGGPSPIKADG